MTDHTTELITFKAFDAHANKLFRQCMKANGKSLTPGTIANAANSYVIGIFDQERKMRVRTGWQVAMQNAVEKYLEENDENALKHKAILCDLETAAKSAYFDCLGALQPPTNNDFWDTLWADATGTLDGDETDVEAVKNEIGNALQALINDIEKMREAISEAQVES